MHDQKSEEVPQPILIDFGERDQEEQEDENRGDEESQQTNGKQGAQHLSVLTL